DSVVQRLLRTIRNISTFMSSSEIVESKDATLAFIQDTVNMAITLIAVYRRDKDKFKQDIANIIVENLENSKGGIRNLIATYQNDRKFISEAEAVIQTLEVRIKNMTSKGYMPGISDASFMPIVSQEPPPSPVDSALPSPVESASSSSVGSASSSPVGSALPSPVGSALPSPEDSPQNSDDESWSHKNNIV
ncbi:hypothetical protein LCGC14_2956760, partial [marine sediment metagenome]